MPPSNEYGVVLTIPSSDLEQNIVLHFEKGHKLSNNKIIGGDKVKIPLRIYWVN